MLKINTVRGCCLEYAAEQLLVSVSHVRTPKYVDTAPKGLKPPLSFASLSVTFLLDASHLRSNADTKSFGLHQNFFILF